MQEVEYENIIDTVVNNLKKIHSFINTDQIFGMSDIESILGCARSTAISKNHVSFFWNLTNRQYLRKHRGNLIEMRDWMIPAPKVETTEDFCRTMLYWHESLSEWSKEEKIRTCYIYVCYCYVNGIEVSNAVLRERFGISEANKAMASRIIKDTLEAGKIKLADPNAVVKMRRYIPHWA